MKANSAKNGEIRPHPVVLLVNPNRISGNDGPIYFFKAHNHHGELLVNERSYACRRW
jgi:hypothetical protein